MNKTAARILSLALSLFLLGMAMAGCSGNVSATGTTPPPATSAPTAASAATPTAQAPTAGPDRSPVTYKTVINTIANDPIDPANAASILAIQELFGVTMDVEIASGDPNLFDQRIRLLATSGDLPDIIYEFNGGLIDELADEGFLYELDENLLFDKCPTIATMFTQDELSIGKYKGVLYQLPQRINAAYNAVYVRGDWMETLGLGEPQTLEEFEAMLRAFTYDDPDGNGVDDTYGWGERNLIGGNFSTIFGAYGIIPQFWQVYEGEVYYGFTHPGIFEPLELLQRWYSEKLIDPEWVTTSTDDWWGKIATSKLGAFTAGIGSYNGIMDRITPNNPDGYVVRIPAPAGPSGKGGIHSYGNMHFGPAFNKDIESFDRVLEIYEYMAQEDALVEMALGEEGTDYKLLSDGGYEILLTDDQKKQTGIGWYPIMLASSNTMSLTPYGNINLIEKLQTPDEKKAFSMYTPVAIYDAFVGYKRPEREVNLSDKYGDISSILLTGLFEVVCGRSSVEDYQNYIDEWYESGGREITAEANEDYQAMLESRK